MREKAFENIIEKEENAGNQHLLLFFQNVFYLIKDNIYNFNYIKFYVCMCFPFTQI